MSESSAAIPARIGPRPSWRALRARPESVRQAREFASTAVFGLAYDPYEVALVASEVVTNAVRAACALRAWPDDTWPIGVEMTATARYAHLVVTDPDHRPLGGVDESGPIAERGRGLTIVDRLAAARWVAYFEHRKAVHVVLAASDVTLTIDELAAIRHGRPVQ